MDTHKTACHRMKFPPLSPAEADPIPITGRVQTFDSITIRHGLSPAMIELSGKSLQKKIGRSVAKGSASSVINFPFGLTLSVTSRRTR